VAAASDCEIVVNVQGDLPLLEPRWIDLLVERIAADPTIGMATVAVPIASREELLDPNVVKVVCDVSGRALYFSRAPIPVHRDDATGFLGALHHVGLYAYRRATLLRFAQLAPTRLEQTEKLEQLRALENGIGIGVVVIDDRPPLEVDTPADLERARKAVLDSSR
jgi:3-deoxy-manno-octulosonate cytidylyltransferase (CMP-KDO synthetase)